MVLYQPPGAPSRHVASKRTGSEARAAALAHMTGDARVARAADEGLDTQGGKWIAVCDEHGTFVQVSTRHDASTSSRLDFCDECREEMKTARGED